MPIKEEFKELEQRVSDLETKIKQLEKVNGLVNQYRIEEAQKALEVSATALVKAKQDIKKESLT